jgi:hypothetical protein
VIYSAIGKAVVKYALLFLRQRYARPLRIGAGLAAVAIGIAAYLASRNVPEG